MAHSSEGTAADALQRQEIAGVPVRLRGAWYHVSKNKDLAQFRDDHKEDWIFLTRSPGGGTDWGDRVLEVFVVAPPEVVRFFPPDNMGDKEGWHDDKPLPDWWVIIAPKEAGVLMVTKRLHLTQDAAAFTEIRNSEKYQAIRQAAIAALKK